MPKLIGRLILCCNTGLAKAAFELLRKTARSQRRKLAELATEVIRANESLNLDI